MKIIYLHQYFKTPDMNGGTYSYEMARRLVARGHEVHMVTADCETSVGRIGNPSYVRRRWYRTEEAGIQVHWIPLPYSNRMSYKRRLRTFLEFAWLAARKAVTLPGDVVYASSSPLTIALAGVRAARSKSIPMVFEVADLWPDTPIAVGALKSRPAIAAARWLERFAYRNAARVVAFSPDMKKGIQAAGCPAEKVTVIYNGCDLRLFQVPESAGHDFRSRYGWLGNRPLVVYTGTLGVVNGVDYLARLAAAVRRRDPEIRFLVMGDGCRKDEVRRAARECGVLDRNFFMLPPVPKTELPAVLSAADLATSTVIDRKALWANSASKVYDAMAASRPVAVNHGGWLAKLIRESHCGLVLDARDFERAGAELVAAVGNRRGLAAAGAAARRVGEDRFDRGKLSRRLESVLGGVVPSHRLRAG